MWVKGPVREHKSIKMTDENLLRYSIKDTPAPHLTTAVGVTKVPASNPFSSMTFKSCNSRCMNHGYCHSFLYGQNPKDLVTFKKCYLLVPPTEYQFPTSYPIETNGN